MRTLPVEKVLRQQNAAYHQTRSPKSSEVESNILKVKSHTEISVRNHFYAAVIGCSTVNYYKRKAIIAECPSPVFLANHEPKKKFFCDVFVYLIMQIHVVCLIIKKHTCVCNVI